MAVTIVGARTIIILSILTALSTIAVFFRLRRRQSRGFLGSDDWLLLSALVLLYFQNFWGYIFATIGGQGIPGADLTFDQLTWLFRCYYFPDLFYSIHVTLIKVSILLSYKRIFGHIQWSRRVTIILMVICVCWSIASFIPFLFQCSPIYKAYRPWVKGKCFSLNKWLWGTTISNAIIDWMILLVPIVPLWTLNLSRMETPLVFAAFMFGSLACIASTARAALSVSLDYADFGVGSFFAVLTIFAEPMLAIISACLPFLPISRPLINAFLAFKRKVSQGSRHKATPKPDSGPSPQDSRAYIEDLSGSISLTHSRPSTITTVRPDTGERTREFVG